MASCLFCGAQIKPEDVLFGIRREETDRGNSEGELPEGDDGLGRWVKDERYEDYLGKYLYMDDRAIHRRQEIFAVKWSKDKCEHKIGKVNENEEVKGGVPKAVELCDDDARAAGRRFFSTCFCPECHCEIMSGYIEAEKKDVHQIAFVGGSRAGKTQYLTAIYQNLFEQSSLSSDYELASIELDALSQGVMEHLSKMLRGGTLQEEEHQGRAQREEADLDEADGGGHMDATPIKPILPIVMRLTKLDRDGGLGKKTYVAIYDCPGEVFLRQERDAMLEQEGLRNADALLFMADAAQLFSALRSHAREDEQLKHDTCMQPLIDIIEQFRSIYGDKKYVAISFVVTKWDMVIEGDVCKVSRKNMDPEAAKALSVLHSKDWERHKGEVDMNEIRQVSNEMRNLLGDEEEGGEGKKGNGALFVNNAVRMVEKNLGGMCDGDLNKIRFLCVSTYSRERDTDKFVRCVEASSNRHRLLEPLLYLLAMFDAVNNNSEGSDSQPAENTNPPRRGLLSRLFGPRED